jgi:hypothetical protein
VKSEEVLVEVDVVVVDVVVGVVEVVVLVVGAVVVVGVVVGAVVVVGVVVGAVVVVEEDVVPSSPPPPASAMTAMSRPMTSAATRPIATFWPVVIPPSSS